MRPTRLELSGFTSFRQATVIDFEGADYFALVGPTGSGKSTIIDAICFALYGSVPRYEDRRLVAPVISQGRLEAKVRLDFSVDGATYTAVRIVRRSGKGATTKEARLEKDGEVIAGNADELSREVARLLGLSFDHFTRCVVLPQGEFARFLHDDPKDRQDLLVKLLNLGVYEVMRKVAGNAAAEAKYQVQVLEDRLNEELTFASGEALAEARATVTELEDLRKTIAKAAPELEALGKEIQRAEEEVQGLRLWTQRIDSLVVPKGVPELASKIITATKGLAADEKTLVAASTAADTAANILKELPDKSPLAAALKAHDRQGALIAKLSSAQATLDKATFVATDAAASADSAERESEAAERQLTEARDANLAAHLASGLEPGDDCPVCLQTVATLPRHPTADVTKKGESALAGAKKAASKARDASSKAASAHAAAQAAVKGLEEQAAELTSELKDHPDPDAITATLTSIKEAEVALEDKQAFESQVRRDLEDARAALGTARDQENAARTAFESARDGLVPLEPPPAAREDLAADWDRLIGWAKTRQSALAKETKDAEKAVNAGRVKLAKLNDALEAACTGCGLEVGRGSVVEAAVTAHTQAIESVKQIEKAIADATKMRRQLKGARLEQATNHELANHLSAKAGMFESWIVGAALERLVQGAGEILRELSDDQYSLRIDDKGSFLVTDRHNADETRSARTLSGGETFLASLALALALADQLADLATEGAAHLDAIFLDEGFGTLDDQTLRTVADTVEKLASSGRMVGVVTHVKELADSVPLHFRVKKDSGGSTVERIAM